ncbi:MAG TPA: hypothetical protein VMU84_19895 [Thermoanaerobaculia bacterium]|nr:hypothetical protein [Thermoanaerobaculia bacterium]
MSKHLYLPPLHSEANIKEPIRSGHWENSERRVMMQISDGILVDENAKVRGVSSVPDIWARPLMFQSAIRPASGHPLRERLVAEWRGLLSMIALARVTNYKLDIVQVTLNQGRFANALRNLEPRPVQLEKGRPYRWSDIFLVKYDDVVVGALSPVTLVYTATDYQRELKKRGPTGLVDAEGNLCPPNQSDEKLAVAEWVVSLQRRLNHPRDRILDTDHKNPDSATVNLINALLDEWVGDLREDLGLRAADEVDSKEVAVASEPIEQIHDYRVYEEILKPLAREPEAPGAHRSDLALRVRSDRNYSSHREVIVITPRLLRSNGKVWKSLRLAHLGGEAGQAIARFFKTASGTRIDREDLSEDKAVWIRPELYFLTDTLLTAPAKGDFLSASEQASNADARYVLPFRREILDFFPADEIVPLLQPEYRTSDRGVVFSFRLPVGTMEFERVEKLYREKGPNEGEGVIRPIPVPVLELFPNYLDRSWRRYYMFQADCENVSSTPVVFGDNDIVTQTRDGRNKITQITGDAAFPEGIALAAAQNDEPIGLIVIPRPKEPHSLTGTWRIGIDFGTSNTNIYLQSDSAAHARQWSFDYPKHLRQLTASETAYRTAALEEYLVPPRRIDLPIATNLRIFNPAERKHMLLDYSIYLASNFTLPPNVYADIKWDREQERKTEYFLECLLFLLMMEAVAGRVETVELVCSYPKAFSLSTINIFKLEWERVFNRLLDEGPNRSGNEYTQRNRIMNRRRSAASDPDRIAVSAPDYRVEAIAAGHYFASEKTITRIEDRLQRGNLEICIDVGGGTTDISVWYGNRILSDASILLAGRQISGFLQHNAIMRGLLFEDGAARALEERKDEPASFAARLNIVLRKDEASIQDRLIKHANRREIEWMRRMLATEFGAVAYYTAALVTAVCRANDSDLVERLSDSGIGVHWGGNAAKFLSWVDFGRFSEDGVASKILKALVYNSLKEAKLAVRSERVGQKQSPGHKSEVAGGLVVMDFNLITMSSVSSSDYEMVNPSSEGPRVDAFDFEAARQRDDGGVPCGENVELVSGDRIEYHTSVSKNFFFEGTRTRLKRTTLERLTQFVDMMNYFGVRFGLFADDTKIRLGDRQRGLIADTVRGSFIEAAAQEEARRVVEPIFISEVKVLLELMKESA